MVLSIFPCTYCPFVSISLKKHLFESFAHLKTGLCLLLSCKRFLIYFRHDVQNFLNSVGCLFHLLESILCMKVLYFDVCLYAQWCPTFCKPVDYSLQASLSIELSWQEYWGRLPFLSPGILRSKHQTRTSCISSTGRWVFYHYDTWEAIMNS